MKSKKVFLLFVLIYGLNMFIAQSAVSFPEPLLEVHFINVGQGDSIYIRTPQKKHILVDGGPPEAGEIVVDYLEKHDVDTIDLMIATHPHYDHIGGLIKVIDKIPTQKIIQTDIIHPTKTYFLYKYQLWKQMIPVNIPVHKEQIFKEDNFSLEVIKDDTQHSTINNLSLALRLEYQDISFLLLSDLENEAEDNLQQKIELEADVIKVAHHGSSTSSSFDFLQQIDPKIAILTYGRENKFGHPHRRVVENINFLDVLIYSTATFGNIVVRTDGKEFYVTPTNSPLEQAFTK